MPPITKTPQQEAITAHVRKSDESLNVVARAGSGKTTSLLMICEVLDGSAFLGAFNKGIAEELKTRLRGIENSMIEAGTFHSLGFRGWKHSYPKVRIDNKGEKIWSLINNLKGSIKESSGGAIKELVALAKNSLFEGNEEAEQWRDLIDYYGVQCNSREDQIITSAIEVFRESAEQCREVVDFDDMLWAPLHFNVDLPKYETMLCDESQDFNLARQELAVRSLEKGGRLIAVGDPAQSIYGWTGADCIAMDRLQQRMNSKSLPLTVSWRCSQKIIERAQLWVPDIEHAPNAIEGQILSTKESALLRELLNNEPSATVPYPGDVVLCRNTKPLVAMAFHCIRNRIGVAIEGRDIGKRLIKLVEKFKEESLSKLIDRIEAYAQEEKERLVQKGKLSAVDSLLDTCGTVEFLAQSLHIEGKKNTRELTDLLGSMFSDTGSNGTSTILLSTIHKAKGKEWGTVFILGEDAYQPSKWAKQDWMKQQERNLQYVATTRAKNALVHIQI